MWFFDGTIVAKCMQCNAEVAIPVSDLDADCYGGEYHENGMGAESNYALTNTYTCNNCRSEFEINYDATEYPEGFLSYVINNSKGVICSGEPFISHIDDEEPIFTFDEQEIYVPSTKIITDISDVRNTIPQLIRLIQQDSSHIYRINPREFEEIVGEIFRQQGFDVELTKRTRDGGKDIIAIHRNVMGIDTRYFIECKRYSPDNKIDVSIVRTLYGVHSERNGPNKSILATTSSFTPDAVRFVQNNVRSTWEIELKDINDVLSWISKYRFTPR